MKKNKKNRKNQIKIYENEDKRKIKYANDWYSDVASKGIIYCWLLKL